MNTRAVAFDVIGTLFDLSPLNPRLRELGLTEGSLETWFARLLRDAFALEIAGEYRPFAEIASAALSTLLIENGASAERLRIDQVLESFAELPAFPDVKPAFEKLRAASIPIATVTNGNAKTTAKMLQNAGLDGYVSKIISIDEVKHWKPAREVYLHAAHELSVAPGELALVAAHDWDTQGARNAGLTAAGVKRKPFSTAMRPPHLVGDDLVGIIERLVAPNQ